MKLSLVVLAAGKMQGKVIPITVPEFVVGRDPQCQLRPASALISNRHCAFIQREGKVFARDLSSTNGTLINDRPFTGDIEVHNGDVLKAGPLAFRIVLETTVPVTRSTPLPPSRPQAASDDDAAATLLLSLHEEGDPVPGGSGVDSSGIPMGSTVMDVQSPPAPKGASSQEPVQPAGPSGPVPAKSGDTSSAAKNILEKYLRRPRP
jgi:predicted component of type VI protein secretion system